MLKIKAGESGHGEKVVTCARGPLPLFAMLGLVTALLLCTEALAGNEPTPPKGSRINRPQDTAPDEQIVTPRPAVECRPEGSLLGRAHHKPAQIDTDELRRRKLALYDGKKINQSLQRPGGFAAMSAPRKEVPTTPAPATHLGYIDGTFWAMIVVSVLATLWLFSKSFLAWRRQKS